MIIYAACHVEEELFRVDCYWGKYAEEIDGYFIKKDDALNAVKFAENNYRNIGKVEHNDSETIVWISPDLRYIHYVREIEVK